MTKHTPGPWTVIGREIHGPDDSGAIVARIPEWGVLADITDPGLNNARLIAAAPDLLDALRTIVAHAASVQLDPQWAVRIARQAIEQATTQGADK